MARGKLYKKNEVQGLYHRVSEMERIERREEHDCVQADTRSLLVALFLEDVLGQGATGSVGRSTQALAILRALVVRIAVVVADNSWSARAAAAALSLSVHCLAIVNPFTVLQPPLAFTFVCLLKGDLFGSIHFPFLAVSFCHLALACVHLLASPLIRKQLFQ